MDGPEKKRGKIVLAGIFIVALTLILYDIFFGKMGLFEYLSLRNKYETLEGKKVKMEEDIEKLKMEEYNLKNNMNYIEDIARKDLGLIKEREKIIILQNEDPGEVETEENGDE